MSALRMAPLSIVLTVAHIQSFNCSWPDLTTLRVQAPTDEAPTRKDLIWKPCIARTWLRQTLRAGDLDRRVAAAIYESASVRDPTPEESLKD